jgi:hypothetical protein
VGLPFALKGVDVVIYTVFRSLGLKVKIRPVLEDIEDDGEEGYLEGDLVGTALHGMKLSSRGGYGDESTAEVHPDPKCFVMLCSPYSVDC